MNNETEILNETWNKVIFSSLTYFDEVILHVFEHNCFLLLKNKNKKKLSESFSCKFHIDILVCLALLAYILRFQE